MEEDGFQKRNWVGQEKEFWSVLFWDAEPIKFMMWCCWWRIKLALTYRYLLTTLDRNLVKPQDVKVVLAGVAVNPEGQLLAWRHLKAHWHYLQSMFGNSTYIMGTFISAVTSHFTTEYDYQEVQIIFSCFIIVAVPLSSDLLPVSLLLFFSVAGYTWNTQYSSMLHYVNADTLFFE
jgi:hypothetical protein